MRFRHRIIAAWLLLALSLPSPAVALRQVEPLERRAGLEELNAALTPAAGLEEGRWDPAKAGEWFVLGSRAGGQLLEELLTRDPARTTVDVLIWGDPERSWLSQLRLTSRAISIQAARTQVDLALQDPHRGEALVLIAPDGSVGIVHQHAVPVGQHQWWRNLVNRTVPDVTEQHWERVSRDQPSKTTSPAAGLEEAALAQAVAAWGEIAATPARETPKRLFPIFYAPETFRVIPLVAKGGLPFVAIVGSDLEEARVRALLDGLGIHPENYWIRQAGPTGDRAAFLSAIHEEFAAQYEVLPVAPGEAWLQTLLAGLEDVGVLPLGDLDRALEVTDRYFARLA